MTSAASVLHAWQYFQFYMSVSNDLASTSQLSDGSETWGLEDPDAAMSWGLVPRSVLWAVSEFIFIVQMLEFKCFLCYCILIDNNCKWVGTPG